ncbi:Cytochrome c oxidase subunit 6B [Malassezia caprae]|uniref:Cytochrome c oxidase subunit 12, mitochondrial n=1 Tax=Malassezia caprae TaxID=1381934 RepID=A0AAF0E7I3_9BASI|nr:Cytochrome c oxidase subunit 6B [Malassezia caprae]
MAEQLNLKTVEFDSRFPNQTRHCRFEANSGLVCWQNYVDYFRCVNSKGEEFEPCKQFYSAFHSLCPNEWLEKWDEQRENGAFPAKLEA